jgi:methionine-rich copper-binding protein CopC
VRIWLVSSTIAVVFALAVAPRGASAHTGYDHSTPGKSESVDEPPDRVDLWFTAALMAGEHQQLWVEDEDGDKVASYEGEVSPDEPTKLSVGLPEGLPDGRYTVRWYVRAADGMFAEGAFRFYVGVEPTQEQLDEDAQLVERIAIMDDGGGGPNIAAIVAAAAAVAVLVVGGGVILMSRRRAA